MRSHYLKLQDKIELWKKANTDYIQDCKDYLLVSFSDPNSVSVNQKEKVETEKYVVVILLYTKAYIALNGQVFNNRHFKVFYFTRHEYGDFFELDYIPLENNWMLKFYMTPVDHQASLDSIVLSNTDSAIPSIEVDFQYDYLDSAGPNSMAPQKIAGLFSSIISKATSSKDYS